MNQGDLDRYKDFVATYCYENLVSTPKAEDYSMTFYKMALANQRATESDYRRFAGLFANALVAEISANGAPKTSTGKRNLTGRCLKAAWKLYQNGE